MHGLLLSGTLTKEKSKMETSVFISGRKARRLYGSIDVLIIKGNELLDNEEIEPRRKGVLTPADEDALKK